MRVLLFRYKVATGGVVSWMLLHARELTKLGIDCEFFFCGGGTRVEDFQRIGGTRIGTIPELAQALGSGRYDAVHATNNDAVLHLAPLVAKSPKVVATSHGELYGWNSTECFAMTAVSPDLARLNQPLSDLEVEVITNGIDVEQFRPPERASSDSPIVCWVGRSHDFESKDFPRFTRIAHKLEGKGIRFWVADAHSSSWLDFAGQDCRQVEFDVWRRVAYPEMPSFFQSVASAGGALLMTSTYEGWPMVAMEANACGAATIAPDVGGLHDLISPGVNGYLFDPAASDQQVADLILRSIEERRGGSGLDACTSLARNLFSAERMSRRYAEVYARKQQQMRTSPIRSWDRGAPGMAALLSKHGEMRWKHAHDLRTYARELAADGAAKAAVAALRRSLKVYPRSFAQPRVLGSALKTALVAATERRPPRPSLA